jgi:holliday junction DNA helicase RuvA
MIGRLSGTLAWRGTDRVLLDVRGVGYEVFIGERTRMALPGLGEALTLWTEMVVREDIMQLYGFLTLEEREWHRLLTTVQGVGARTAQAILGTLGASGTARAISIGDWASVKAAPGIGPKLAQRIVLELKGKAHTVMALGGAAEADVAEVIEPVTPSAPAKAKPAKSSASAQSEALSALTNLGYGPSEAAQAVAQAADEGADTVQVLIRAALKLLAPK